MKTLASESYNVAWFKLADFVARGEKERALSVLRLLMHSISNEALTYQLEGDILLAFDDFAALERYQTAATLFKKSGKFQQAVSVYHHALLFKEDEKILHALLDAYILMQHKTGILETFAKIATILLTKQNRTEVIALLEKSCETLSDSLQAQLHARLVKSVLLNDAKNELITQYIYRTIDLYQTTLLSDNLSGTELQKFLVNLKILNHKEYKKAEAYLKEQK